MSLFLLAPANVMVFRARSDAFGPSVAIESRWSAVREMVDAGQGCYGVE